MYLMVLKPVSVIMSDAYMALTLSETELETTTAKKLQKMLKSREKFVMLVK